MINNRMEFKTLEFKKMVLPLISYDEYKKTLPRDGNHINAFCDSENRVVYQAFSPKIGIYAKENQCFGGEFYRFNRMTWIKPSFLWMMSRYGWGKKEWADKKDYQKLLIPNEKIYKLE